MWKDFKTFISRGNVVDLAVAVVIGAAFTKIINTIADGLISPLVSLIGGGGLDFKDKTINMSGQDVTGLTAKEIVKKRLGGFSLRRTHYRHYQFSDCRFYRLFNRALGGQIFPLARRFGRIYRH